jgi:hypothetical protein
MHAKRQGLLPALLIAPLALFKVVLFKVVFASDEPKHLKSTGRSKGWGRKVVFLATLLATLAAFVVPAFAASNALVAH